VELREFSFGSSDYEGALALRHRILREPLGVEWTAEERAWEPVERHFGLMENDQVVACVVARPLGEDRFKIRQMAVEPERQREGVGKDLLVRVEARLGVEGVREFELNARDVAVGFYEKLGYTRVGEQFVEVGIPHWKMEKVLADL